MLGLGVSIGRTQKPITVSSAPQEYQMVFSKITPVAGGDLLNPVFTIGTSIVVQDATTRDILYGGTTPLNSEDQTAATATVEITREEDGSVGYCDTYVYYNTSPTPANNIFSLSLTDGSASPTTDVLNLATSFVNSEGVAIDLTPLSSSDPVNTKLYTLSISIDSIATDVTVGSSVYTPLASAAVTQEFSWVYVDQTQSTDPLLNAYSSNFSSDTDSWDFSGAWTSDPTLTSNSTAVGGKTDTLKLELNSDLSSTVQIYRPNSSKTGGWKAGDKVFVYFTYYSRDNAPANSVTFQVRLGTYSSTAGNIYTIPPVTDGQWTEFNQQFTLLEDVSQEDFIISLNNGGARPGDGDILYFRDFHVIQTGVRV